MPEFYECKWLEIIVVTIKTLAYFSATYFGSIDSNLTQKNVHEYPRFFKWCNPSVSKQLHKNQVFCDRKCKIMTPSEIITYFSQGCHTRRGYARIPCLLVTGPTDIDAKAGKPKYSGFIDNAGGCGLQHLKVLLACSRADQRKALVAPVRCCNSRKLSLIKNQVVSVENRFTVLPCEW